MDIVSYMTTKLVDDFASHLRLYRLAQNKLKEQKVNGILTLDLILLKIIIFLINCLIRNRPERESTVDIL
jgi:hypothetical protein